MAQGRWLSYFSLLYLETGEQKYKNIADKIFVSFKNLHDKPTVIVVDSFNNYWIEEYVVTEQSPYHPDASPTHVLNGFVTAIWGLYDYYWIEQDPEALHSLQSAITTLYKRAYEYRRFGGNSYYCLKHQKHDYSITSLNYHNIHITQLGELYQMTNENYFEQLQLLFIDDVNGN